MLNSERHTIREVAQIIGLLVSSLPTVRCGECHYRALEQDKILPLKTAKGNVDSPMPLSSRSIEELNWWLREKPNSYYLIQLPPVDISLNSDASLTGWGGVMSGTSAGGFWTKEEASHHINYLELLAAFFVLKSFLAHLKGKHVKILIDNTAAVSVINNKGTNHSEQCNEVTRNIWLLCEQHNIWLTAAHSPGKQNITADQESRNQNVDTEWMLNPNYLSTGLSKLHFSPQVDLFASRLNKQFDTYVSYKPDPYARHIDAFNISWANEKFYCFPHSVAS